MPILLPEVAGASAGPAGGGGILNFLSNLLGSGGGSAGGGSMGFTGAPGGMGFLDILRLLSGGGAPPAGGSTAGGVGSSPDLGQLFQLMLLQQLGQSPFYQGVPTTSGAGGQIMQALLPFLTAGVQSKFLTQQTQSAEKEKQYAAGEKQLERGRQELQDLEKAQQFYVGEIGKTRRAKEQRKGEEAKAGQAQTRAIELENLRQRGRIAAKGVPQAREPSTRDALLEELVGKMKPDQKDAFLKQLFLHSDLLSILLSGGAALGGGTTGAPGTMSDEELKKKFTIP